MRKQQGKNGAFKMNDALDKSFNLLYGHEPKESYNERLKKSAQRVVFGQPGPIACYDCDSSDEPDLLEIHHLLDEDSGMTGNNWREIHGKGSEFYRSILRPDGHKPELILLCPLCHSRRHHTRANKYDQYDKFC